MIENYLKIAWRNLIKNKGYSLINIGGLSVGMAVAILISLWIQDELSANKHHKNYSSLYQVMMYQTFDGRRGAQEALPYPMGPELKEKYPDFAGVAMCDWGGRHSLGINNQKFLKEGHFIGQDAINMFSFNIVDGDKDPLKDPYSIVLTSKLAKTIFGDESPIGKTIKMDNIVDLHVSAIVAEQPKNATLQFDFLIPWHLQEKIYPGTKNRITQWGNNSYQVFVQLKEGILPQKANNNIKDVVLNHLLNEANIKDLVKPEVFLHPMSKWRLYSEFENGKNTGGFIKYVKLFGLFGLFILIIACINFMNLSTARSEKRAKEVGVRKAVGSMREQLIGQFLSESLLIACMALIVSWVIVFISLPDFNSLTEKSITVQFNQPSFWAMMVLFTLFTGLLAGSYPALYLSSFNPVQIFKRGVQVGKSAVLPRKMLVIIQFTFSIVLMIGTIVVNQQIQYGKDRPIGFNNKGLVVVDISRDLKKNFEPLKNELIASGMVTSICQSSSPPYQIWSNNNGWEWKGSTQEDKSIIFNTIATSYDYLKTIGIPLKDGRDFSRDFGTDSTGVILNEAAVKRMGLKNPINELVRWNGSERKIIGVVPDVNMASPFSAVAPLTIIFDKEWVNCVDIRLNPGMSTSEAIKKISPIFDSYNPGSPFDYKFTDTEYAKKFNYEELIGNLSLIVSILAIFISCLGLFGLASFMAEQRTKEIGIRKVFGASIANVWGLLSQDFVRLVVISCLIACPIAYYGMNTWLENYKEYKIDIGAGVFVLVLMLALVITLITVSFQSIKAAIANPIKSLRNE
ncbi:MAG: ABC transporter permease [Saprospiraceae bacterium]